MKQFLDTVLTLIGDYHDPSIRSHVDFLIVELLKILAIGKNEFRVKTVEPWNSVRVTFNIPRNAALRLRQLAISSQERCVLRDLGILTVQIQGENAIPISHVTSGDGTNSQRPDSIVEHFNAEDFQTFRDDISASQVSNTEKTVIDNKSGNSLNSPDNNNFIGKSMSKMHPLYYKMPMQGVSNPISNHSNFGVNNYINFKQESFPPQPSMSPINNIQLDNSFMTHDIIDAVGLHELKDLKELAPSDIINEVDSTDNFNVNDYADERIFCGTSKVQSNAYLLNPFNNIYGGHRSKLTSHNDNLQTNNNFTNHNLSSTYSGNNSQMFKSFSNHNIPLDKFVNPNYVPCIQSMENSYEYNHINFTKFCSQNFYYKSNPSVLYNKSKEHSPLQANMISDNITSHQLSHKIYTKNDSAYEFSFVTTNYSYNLTGSQFPYNSYGNPNNHGICKDVNYNIHNRTHNYPNAMDAASKPTISPPASKENLSLDSFNSPPFLTTKTTGDYSQYHNFQQTNLANSISIPSTLSIFNYDTSLCPEEKVPRSNSLPNTDPILSSPLLVNLLQKNTNYSALGSSKGFIPPKLIPNKRSSPTIVDDLSQHSFSLSTKETFANQLYCIPPGMSIDVNSLYGTKGAWNTTLPYDAQEESLKSNLNTINSIDYPTYTSCSKKMSSLLLSSSNLTYQTNPVNSQNKSLDDHEIYKFPMKCDASLATNDKAIFVSPPNSINTYKKARLDHSLLNPSLVSIIPSISNPLPAAPNRKRKRYPKTSVNHEHHLKPDATNSVSTNLGSSYTYTSQSPSSLPNNKKVGSTKKDDHKNSMNFSSKYNSSSQNAFAASSLSITEIVSQNLAAIKNAMKNVKASIVTTAGNGNNKSSPGHFNHSHSQQKGFSKGIAPLVTLTYPITAASPNTNAIPPNLNKLATANTTYHHHHHHHLAIPPHDPVVSSSLSNSAITPKHLSSPIIMGHESHTEEKSISYLPTPLLHPFNAVENYRFDDCIILVSSSTQGGQTPSHPICTSPNNNQTSKINGMLASPSKYEGLYVANPAAYSSSPLSHPFECDSNDDKELTLPSNTFDTPITPDLSAISANDHVDPNTLSDRGKGAGGYLDTLSSSSYCSPPFTAPPNQSSHLLSTPSSHSFTSRPSSSTTTNPLNLAARNYTEFATACGGGDRFYGNLTQVLTNGVDCAGSASPSPPSQRLPPTYCNNNEDSPFFQLINPLIDHRSRGHHQAIAGVEGRRCRPGGSFLHQAPTLNEINTAPMSRLLANPKNNSHIMNHDNLAYTDTSSPSGYLEEPSIASYFHHHHHHNNVGLALVDEGLEDDLLAMNDGAGLMDTTDIMLNNHSPPTMKCEQFNNTNLIMDQQDLILYNNISSS